MPPLLYRPPPLAGAAPGDRQSRDRRRDTRVDLEHPARPPPLTVTPAAGPVIVVVPVVLLSSSWPRQGDRLRRVEDGRVEVDRVGPAGRIRLGDRPAQGADAAVSSVLLTVNVDSSVRSSSVSSWPHPLPLPALERPAPRFR